MPPAKKKIEVKFTDSDPKKRVIRFNADGSDPAVSALYLTNTGFKELGSPEKGIKITIEAL